MEYDPAYLAAIEREQCRLIDEELARLKAQPQPMHATMVTWDGGTIEIIKVALADMRQEQKDRERQRVAFPEVAAAWLERIEGANTAPAQQLRQRRRRARERKRGIHFNYSLAGKPKATIVAVRERKRRELES